MSNLVQLDRGARQLRRCSWTEKWEPVNPLSDLAQAYDDTNSALNGAWDATGSQLVHGNWSPGQLISGADWSASLNWANRSIDPVYAIYHSYNLIWQAGANGCGWDTLLGLLPGAIIADVSIAPGDEEGADLASAASHELLATPQVESGGRLQRIIDALYEGTKNPGHIGNGTTADAVRYELETGAKVYGRSHSEKAANALRGLENWLKSNPDASYRDRLVAQSVADDLRNALGGTP
jgi:hypothetical protein